MAARVLLLGILFTEVLEPVCAAGVRGSGGVYNRKNGSKIDGLDLGLTKGPEATLEIEPGGSVILGKRGITLSCLSSGNNQDISWLHNGVPAPPCGIARCALLHNGSLHFYKKQNLQLAQKSKGRDGVFPAVTKVSKKHEYRCIARTNFGGLLRSAPTFIQVAELSHTFKESPEDLTVREGEIARLSCLIDSVPFPPNITWQHNGETVSLDRNSTKYYLISPGVLYISATKLSDAGSYRCIATNDLIKKTKKSKEAKLTVVSRPEKNGRRVPVSLLPQVSYNHRMINGSSLSLACAATGYPSPTVTWTFVPRYSDDAPSVHPRILLNSTKGIAILTLKNINLSNAGLYACSVKNSIVDGPKVQNITLDVMVPPTFLKKPTSQSFPNGRTARFECQAQGTPTPKIYWLKDSANITTNGRRTTYEKERNKMELAISTTVPSDSGVYQCVAVNAAGEIWAAGRLQVNTSRNSPAAPTSLKCYAPSPVKIFISWEPPKSLPSTSITAYTVHYSPEDGGKEEISPPEAGNSTSVEISKLLEPFTNYSFYVRVWNNHGASDQSATIVCSTAPSVPKAAPKVSVDVLSSTKINVSWVPLAKMEARGIIEEYKIQWRLHDQPAYRVHYVPASIQHYTLTDLLPGAQYDLRVLARTRQGYPNISDTQFGWTSVILPSLETDKPDIRNFVYVQLVHLNASIVKMTWNWKEASEEYLPRLNFDSWRLYCEKSNGDKLVNASLPMNSTEYSFTNLETNVSYTIGLCMLNSDVEIDCLTEIIEPNQSRADNIPTALQAVQISSTKILVTWTIPNPNGVHTFEVCYQPVYVTDPDRTKCKILNNVKSIVIDGLKPFTLYQFKVRTLVQNVTDLTTAFSESIECYTSEDVPGKPEDVQWFSLGNGTTARIAWKRPTETNGVIQNYLVTYTTDLTESTMNWGNVTVPGNKTFASLTGLVAGKCYDVMVQASTKAGYGRPSDPIFIITGGSSASKVPTKTDEQKPPQKSKPDQSLGIIIGVSISICCITVCLCSMYCRRKFENSRSLRASVESQKSRALMRTGNGCCVERSTTSMSQQANTQVACNEIELAELCPSSPTSTNPQCDTKGGHENGILENCVKEPLLTSWDSHDESKDLRITENPQCKQGESPVSNRHPEPEGDLDTTELTMVDCTLAGSESSLNNNLGCANSSPRKGVPMSVPVLEPNG